MQQLSLATSPSHPLTLGCSDIAVALGAGCALDSIDRVVSDRDVVVSAPVVTDDGFAAALPKAQHTRSDCHNDAPQAERTDDECLFRQLVKRWDDERGVTSSPLVMYECPAYKSILGMGAAAVPLIIESLRHDGPDHWFAALAELTGEDPIRREWWGDMAKMAGAWIRWDDERKAVGKAPR